MSDKKEYIASLSYGKDSMYMLEIIHQNGLPLDRIITVEVMATPTINGDLPPVVEFKKVADKFIKERYGIEVEHLTSQYGSYEELVYRPVLKGYRIGTNRGVASRRTNYCNKDLKLNPLLKIQKKGVMSYQGYAIDEKNPNRQKKIKDYLENGHKQYVYPLVDYNITEQQAYDWCKENGVLSPAYETATRGGCWFCHNQSLQQWYLLYQNYPELYVMAEKWEQDSNGFTYRSDCQSLKMLREERFDKGVYYKKDLKKIEKRSK